MRRALVRTLIATAVTVSLPAHTGEPPENAAARPSLAAEGGIGLLRLPLTDLGTPGLLRLGLVGEGFLAGDFPVRDARTRHVGGRLSMSYVPLSWLEAFLTLGASSTTSTHASPATLQALGDVALGAKGVLRLPAGFSGGVEARLRLHPAARRAPGRFVFGVEPRLLAAFDAQRVARSVPLRVHVATGFRLEHNPELDAEPLRAAETYALDASRFQRFVFGAGVEVPLPAVTPFLEYGVTVPLGVSGAGLAAPDGTLLTAADAAPQTLGLGVKVTALPVVTFLAAVELGLNRHVAVGLPVSAPFQFVLGASLAVDPVPPSPAAGTPGPPPPCPPTNAPVLPAPQRDPVAPARQASELLPVAPEPLSRAALAVLRVASRGLGVAASVQFAGASFDRIDIPADAPTEVTVELKPGHYAVSVIPEGHLAQTREADLTLGVRTPLTFDVVPSPSPAEVALKDNRLELAQPVRFQPGKARILPESHGLLDQVVDALVRNGIAILRIEGHTDNQGNAVANVALSEARAQAVADFLVSRGIPRERLQTVGFGGSRPIAPNLTPRGRELNRRIDFVPLRP